MELVDIDKAYLAGLIDGEGSIRFSGTYIPRLRRKHYALGIKIAMQSPEAIQYAAVCFDGKMYTHGSLYETVIWQRRARDILEQVSPFLQTKRIQADFGVWLYDLTFGSRPVGAVKLTEVELEIRELGGRIMSLLNHRHSMYFNGKPGEFEEQLSPLMQQLTDMLTPSQAVEGTGSTEGVTTTTVSPNNNLSQERPDLVH